MSKVTTKLECEFVVSGTIAEFCACQNSGGSALIVLGTPENIKIEINQSTGQFTGTPTDLSKPWGFDYDVICKTEMCPECPECADKVVKHSGRYEGTAICEECLPSEETNLFPTTDLPEIVEFPDIDCTTVSLPYTVRNEYYNGQVILTLGTDCTWGDPFIRDCSTSPTLTPNK